MVAHRRNNAISFYDVNTANGLILLIYKLYRSQKCIRKPRKSRSTFHRRASLKEKPCCPADHVYSQEFTPFPDRSNKFKQIISQGIKKPCNEPETNVYISWPFSFLWIRISINIHRHFMSFENKWLNFIADFSTVCKSNRLTNSSKYGCELSWICIS